MNSHLNIHSSASIHPTAILEGDIEIGSNTIIGPHCWLKGPLSIGTDNQIGAQVMIGVDAEHKTKTSAGYVFIGNGNVIREFSVIQRGIGDLDTQIQDNCYIMAYAYIAHDCLLESEAILCARVSLAGHCHVLKGAILGLSSSLHQFSTIGAHAFVGMGSVVVKDVPPFCVVAGNPAYYLKFNTIALEQLNLNIQHLTFDSSCCLQSQDSYVKKCLDDFIIHARRPILPIQPMD